MRPTLRVIRWFLPPLLLVLATIGTGRADASVGTPGPAVAAVGAPSETTVGAPAAMLTVAAPVTVPEPATGLPEPLSARGLLAAPPAKRGAESPRPIGAEPGFRGHPAPFAGSLAAAAPPRSHRVDGPSPARSLPLLN